MILRSRNLAVVLSLGLFISARSAAAQDKEAPIGPSAGSAGFLPVSVEEPVDPQGVRETQDPAETENIQGPVVDPYAAEPEAQAIQEDEGAAVLMPPSAIQSAQ